MDRIALYLNNLPKVIDVDGDGRIIKTNDVVIQNTIKFVKSLPAYYQSIIDAEECITATTHGTIVIDWYFRKNFISVEVGTTKIGWFSELPDGTNPSSQGVLLNETPPDDILKSLDKIYSRSDFTK